MDIHTLLKNLSKLSCVFEYRPKKYMFGLKNYGDIPKMINKADGDPWDVFAPGQKKMDIGKKYKIKQCVGILFLSDGNHKIAVDVTGNVNKQKAVNEISKYAKRYCDYVGVTGHFVPFSLSKQSA